MYSAQGQAWSSRARGACAILSDYYLHADRCLVCVGQKCRLCSRPHRFSDRLRLCASMHAYSLSSRCSKNAGIKWRPPGRDLPRLLQNAGNTQLHNHGDKSSGAVRVSTRSYHCTDTVPHVRGEWNVLMRCGFLVRRDLLLSIFCSAVEASTDSVRAAAQHTLFVAYAYKGCVRDVGRQCRNITE